jgi:hypothetical protein
MTVERLRPITLVYEGPELDRRSISALERGLMFALDVLGVAATSTAAGVMKKTVEQGYVEITVRIPAPLLRMNDPEAESAPGQELLDKIRASEREAFGAGVRQAIARQFTRWRSSVPKGF